MFKTKEEINNLIFEFIDSIKTKHPIKLLKKLYVYRFLISINKTVNLKYNNYTILTSLITYIISLFQSVEIKLNNLSDVSFIELEDIISRFEDIYIYSAMDTDLFEDSKVTSLKDVVSGISYPLITIEIIISLLTSQELLLNNNYDIKINDLFDEFIELSLLLRSLPQNIDLNNEKLFLIIDDVLPDEYFDLVKKTKLPYKFLIDFTKKNGSKGEFIERAEFPGWPNIDAPGKFYPFLEFDNKIYGFDHNLFFDNVYRNIQKNITKNNNKLKNEWNINQQYSSEYLVYSVLSKIFKNVKYLKNNYFYENKGRRLENDLLIIDNDLLLVVEIKAGSFSYRSSRTDSQSHEESISSLVDSPQAQVKTFIDILMEKEELVIYDEKKNEKDQLRIKDFNYILGLTVNIDHFNEITASYYNTEKEKIIGLPISIYDLYILSIYFDNKFEFIHYLKFRLGMFASDMLISEELSYLEMYIVNHHVNHMLIEEKNRLNVGFIMADPNVELIDKYFFDYPNLIKSNKPIKKYDSDIKRIIRIMLNKNGKIYMTATTLLDIDFERQKEVIKESKRYSIWGDKNKKIGFGYTDNDVLKLFVAYVDISRVNKFNFNYTFNNITKEIKTKDVVFVSVIYDKKSTKIIDVIFDTKKHLNK